MSYNLNDISIFDSAEVSLRKIREHLSAQEKEEQAKRKASAPAELEKQRTITVPQVSSPEASNINASKSQTEPKRVVVDPLSSNGSATNSNIIQAPSVATTVVPNVRVIDPLHSDFTSTLESAQVRVNPTIQRASPAVSQGSLSPPEKAPKSKRRRIKLEDLDDNPPNSSRWQNTTKVVPLLSTKQNSATSPPPTMNSGVATHAENRHTTSPIKLESKVTSSVLFHPDSSTASPTYGRVDTASSTSLRDPLKDIPSASSYPNTASPIPLDRNQPKTAFNATYGVRLQSQGTALATAATKNYIPPPQPPRMNPSTDVQKAAMKPGESINASYGSSHMPLWNTTSSVASLPKISKRPRVDAETSSIPASPKTMVKGMPIWYVNLKVDTRKKGQVDREVVVKLESIRRFKAKWINDGRRTNELPELFSKIRHELHTLEFQAVNRHTLKKARMLDRDVGLQEIFDDIKPGTLPYPWDIKADARELHHKWCTMLQDSPKYDPDLLRGIIMHNKLKGHAADRLDPNWPRTVRANFHGSGDLINGQWWPTQLATVRDGAHGATQGGIYGEAGNGAFSIILSGGNHYNDRDEGDEIWYQGTDKKPEDKHNHKAITESTLRMIESCDNDEKRPVRVIRSHGQPKTNRWRPEGGFRYDGLYVVLSYEVLDEEKGAYLFRLRRQPGQDPIRAEGVYKRPTDQELAEYQKLRRLNGPME